jgi:hypothetical protein
MTNTRGVSGRFMNGPTHARPAQSVFAPSIFTSGEGATPAVHSTVALSMRFPATRTPCSSTRSTIAPVTTFTPSFSCHWRLFSIAILRSLGGSACRPRAHDEATHKLRQQFHQALGAWTMRHGAPSLERAPRTRSPSAIARAVRCAPGRPDLVPSFKKIPKDPIIRVKLPAIRGMSAHVNIPFYAMDGCRKAAGAHETSPAITAWTQPLFRP